MQAIPDSIQLFAILDDITFTAPANLAAIMFIICTDKLARINISTVPRKSHLLINEADLHILPADLDPQIQVDTDVIALLGAAIGDGQFLTSFLQDKIGNIRALLAKVAKLHIRALLAKVAKLHSLHTKYEILMLSACAHYYLLDHPYNFAVASSMRSSNRFSHPLSTSKTSPMSSSYNLLS